MILIIGGSYQGKLDFAKTLAPNLEVGGIGAPIINELHKIIYKEVEKNPELEWQVIKEEILNKIKAGKPEIIICNEVGNGIVPTGHLDRLYRETVGRISVELANEAEKVYYIQAGIPTRLK